MSPTMVVLNAPYQGESVKTPGMSEGRRLEVCPCQRQMAVTCYQGVMLIVSDEHHKTGSSKLLFPTCPKLLSKSALAPIDISDQGEKKKNGLDSRRQRRGRRSTETGSSSVLHSPRLASVRGNGQTVCSAPYSDLQRPTRGPGGYSHPTRPRNHHDH